MKNIIKKLELYSKKHNKNINEKCNCNCCDNLVC